MKKLFTFFVFAVLLISFSNASSQTRFGLGFLAGETVNLGASPSPAYGALAFINISSSIQVGTQLGFITGNQSGDKKQFESANALVLAPYGKFILGKMKGVEPFVKVSFAYVSYSYTVKANNQDVTTSQNNSAIWGAMGFNYNAGKGVSVYGQIRVIDLGLSGDVKNTFFGIGAPAVGIDIEL